MATPSLPYTKLPGRGVLFFTYNRLYLAQDHLLHVSSDGFSQSYKRFLFKDIQAIIIRKSMAGLVATLLLAFTTLVCVFLGSIAPPGFKLVMWLLALCFGGCLLWNVILGFTCVTQIKTAVGDYRLAALNRYSTFLKVCQQLHPLIEQAQAQPPQPEGSQQQFPPIMQEPDSPAP